MSEEAKPEPFNPDKGRMYPVLFTAGLAAACGLFLAVLSVATADMVDANQKAKRYRCVLYSFGPYIQVPGESGVTFGWKHCYDPSRQPSTEELNAIVEKSIERVVLFEVDAARVAAHKLDQAGELFEVRKPEGEANTWVLAEKKTIGDKVVNIWAEIMKGEPKATGKTVFEYYVCKQNGKPVGYSLGTSGPGFWEPISCYLAIKPDLFTVIGMSVYSEKDTPGLGGRCDEPDFLAQFFGKTLAGEDEKGNYTYSDLGPRVIAPENKGAETKAEFYVRKEGIAAANHVAAITGASETSNAISNFINKDLNKKLPLLRALLKSGQV